MATRGSTVHRDRVTLDPLSPRHTGRGVVWRLGAITLTMALLQACAATQPEASATPVASATQGVSATPVAAASASVAPLEPLKVAVGSPSVFYGQAYLAEALGYNEELGLDVEIVVAGANQLPMLVAGQVDLMFAGMGGALLPVKDGKETKVIYGFLGNGGAGMLVGTEGITELSQLKRVGTLQVGGSPYGYASFYKDSMDLTYDIVNFGDNGLVNAALASKSIDGAVSSYQALLPLLNEGKLSILIDPRDAAVRKELIGADIPEAGVIGLAETLEAKRDSVTQYLKALDMVKDFYEASTPAEIAAVLAAVPDLQTSSAEVLEQQYESAKTSLRPNNGYISDASWSAALNIYNYWGLDVDLSSPDYAFGERVDMSFYEAGIGKPGG